MGGEAEGGGGGPELTPSLLEGELEAISSERT